VAFSMYVRMWLLRTFSSKLNVRTYIQFIPGGGLLTGIFWGGAGSIYLATSFLPILALSLSWVLRRKYAYYDTGKIQASTCHRNSQSEN